MAHVLIAPLGESPAVVTAMVRALTAHPDGPRVRIETVVLLHPSADHVNLGIDVIKEILARDGQTLQLLPLSEHDTDSYEANAEFLRLLHEALAMHEDDNVYVSCAGGRKSMSALAAVITQFHPHVRGLYHVLDRHETSPTRRSFYSIEELFDLPPEERAACMQPPMDQLLLVDIPFRRLGDAQQLRRYRMTVGGEDDVIDTSGEAEQFFRQVFGDAPISRVLDIVFSTRARQQFLDLDQRDRPRADRFWKCFMQMRDADALRGRYKFAFSQPGRSYHFYKLRRTVERPLFFTEPNPVETNKPVRRVVVAGLSIEQGNGSYDYDDAYWEKQCGADDPTASLHALGSLRQLPAVLVVPVGGSPMVATQTVMLLRLAEALDVAAVGLVYPGRNNAIGDSVTMIRDLAKGQDDAITTLRGCPPFEVIPFPIENCSDVDSRQACEACGRTVVAAIAAMRERYPDQPLHLSISGGRKTMAAMTYYSAQRADVRQVWHTLIGDRVLADRIQRDTTVTELVRLDRRTQARRLFLQAYMDNIDSFSLFPIPVVSIQ